jgi:hypothetical protein
MPSTLSGPTWVLWALSILCALALTADLAFRLPPAKSDLFHRIAPFDSAHRFPLAARRTPSPSCCLATFFDASSVPQTVALGHSFNASSRTFRPRTFAIATSEIPPELLSIVSRYFAVLNATEPLPQGEFTELLFWTLLRDCYPVIGVAHTGLFNRPMDTLCQAEPFSAVARLGDVVYFDPSLMVLDPNEPPAKAPDAPTFAKLINQAFPEWRILPSDASVEDLENEYFDFWLLYGAPIYMHFAEDTFRKAVTNKGTTLGSPALFEMIQRIAGAAAAAHPALFATL